MQKLRVTQQMTETIPLMRIDSKSYREVQPLPSLKSMCIQCALNNTPRNCLQAVRGAAKAAFGDDCSDNGRIYEEVKDA